MGFCEEILEDGDYCLNRASERTGYRCDRCFTAEGSIPMPYEVTEIDRVGVRCWRIVFPGIWDRVFIVPQDNGSNLPYGFTSAQSHYQAWTGTSPIAYGCGVWVAHR